jgi:hypothetical protein
MPAKGSSFWVFAFGYVIFAFGVLSTGIDFHARIYRSFPLDMGIVLGNCALLLLGLTAQVIAQSIRKLERRLERIDQPALQS